MDDRRVGLVIRALRRRRGWRQADLAARAGVSQSVVARAEAGHFDSLALRTTRHIVAALDVRLDLNTRRRGGELDRLVDARHAEIAAHAGGILAAHGWHVMQEVTYAIYRERGSIDLLAVRRAEQIAAMMEVKSEITSWEETQRKFDEKVRLLPRILDDREGWRPRLIAKILVVADTMTNRRRLAAAGAAAFAFPARGRDIRRWLRDPSGHLAGIRFLSAIRRGGARGGHGGFHRVRRPKSR